MVNNINYCYKITTNKDYEKWPVFVDLLMFPEQSSFEDVTNLECLCFHLLILQLKETKHTSLFLLRKFWFLYSHCSYAPISGIFVLRELNVSLWCYHLYEGARQGSFMTYRKNRNSRTPDGKLN